MELWRAKNIMLIGMGIENVANDDVVIVGEEEKKVVIVECAEK